MKTRYVLLLLGIIIFTRAHAQNPGWEKFDKSNSGIPFEKVFKIAFDHDGNVWLGTNVTNFTAHLCKYDGSGFLGESPSHWIYSITCDKDGNIWITNSNKELKKWDGSQWTSVKNDDMGWYSDPVHIDSKGNIWMNPQFSDDLLVYDGTNWTTYNLLSLGLPEGRINALTGDSKNLYVGTDSGLVIYDGTNWTSYRKDLPADRIYAMTIDQNDSVWMVCEGGNLVSYKDGNCNIYQDESINAYVTTLEIDNKGVKWVCMSTKMASYNGQDWEVYDHNNSILPEFSINTLNIDQNDKIWIGTREGLFMYDRNAGDTAISILEQPQGVNAKEGDNVQFKVSAKGQQLAFQWLKDGSPISNENDSVMSISNVQISDAGNYSCEITNPWVKVTTKQVALSVQASGMADLNSKHVKLFPNPVKTKVCISFEGKGQSGARVRIYDLNGKMVCSEKFASANLIEIARDPAWDRGAYLLVTEIEGEVFSRQLILE